MMAGRTGKTESARNAIVHASVHLGEPEELGGFGLAVDIKVEGVEDEELIMAGHDVRSFVAPSASSSWGFAPTLLTCSSRRSRLVPTPVHSPMAPWSTFQRHEKEGLITLA